MKFNPLADSFINGWFTVGGCVKMATLTNKSQPMGKRLTNRKRTLL